jgi:hypothetical protein
MSEIPHSEEHAENHATAVSDDFLKKAGGKLIRWPGHAIFTAVGEAFTHLGGAMLSGAAHAKPAFAELFKKAATIPEIGTALAQNPDLFNNMVGVLTGVAGFTGLASTIIGSYVETQGIKHATSGLEKVAFWGAKAGLLATYMFAPAYVPIAAGISAVSGLISMRHRR